MRKPGVDSTRYGARFNQEPSSGWSAPWFWWKPRARLWNPLFLPSKVQLVFVFVFLTIGYPQVQWFIINVHLKLATFEAMAGGKICAIPYWWLYPHYMFQLYITICIYVYTHITMIDPYYICIYSMYIYISPVHSHHIPIPFSGELPTGNRRQLTKGFDPREDRRHQAVHAQHCTWSATTVCERKGMRNVG